MVKNIAKINQDRDFLAWFFADLDPFPLKLVKNIFTKVFLRIQVMTWATLMKVCAYVSWHP